MSSSSGVEFRDGCLRSTVFDDIYFSVADGLAESRHVFLAGNDLPSRWHGRSRFVIAETGFGTGLNFLALLDLWRQTDPRPDLEYFSVEKFPLSHADLAQALAPMADRLDLRPLLTVYDPAGGRWSLPGTNDRVHLNLLIGEAAERILDLPEPAEAWFLDGFAPARNPEMWSEALLDAVARQTAPGGTLASFTAAGLVKTRLRTAGFEIRRRPGYGTKRHMISGILSDPRSP